MAKIINAGCHKKLDLINAMSYDGYITNEGIMIGSILWYSERDQNGIIKGKDGKEYYFDISVSREILKQSDSIFKNQAVSFELNEKIKDCRCAKNVRLASVEEFYKN